MKTVGWILVLGLIGLGVGYGIFGHNNGNYVSIAKIFSAKEGLLDKLESSFLGLDEMRRNILFCGVGGAVLGLFLGVLSTGRGGRG